jgi:hypothetical protein
MRLLVVASNSETGNFMGLGKNIMPLDVTKNFYS